MKVEYVGLKRGASRRLGSACMKDVILQSDLRGNDVVAIFSVGKHLSCYELEGIAEWFLEESVTRNKLPNLPETMAPVTEEAYKRVLNEARKKIVGFEEKFQNYIHDVSEERKKFVETGSFVSAPSLLTLSDQELFSLLPSAEEFEEFSVEDLLDLLGDGEG